MKRIALLLTLILIGFAGNAHAVLYSFDNITNNSATNAAIGEAQLFVDVTDSGSGQVLFTFSNIGPAASSITDIYFDDDVPLMTYNSFVNSVGDVAFTVGAHPSDLPGGNDHHFSSNYSYDSDNPVQPKGINPEEALGLLFDGTFNDIIAALDGGTMRIGLHVQGFANGGSEAFINNSTAPVPEPATLLLLGTGLIGLAGASRKKLKK